MTCQGPVTQLLYKEGREVRAGSQGNVPGVPSKLSSKLQKANQHLFQGQNYACLEFTRSFSAHLTLQIEHALWIPSLTRTGLELPKWSGPKNKMGNYKAKCTK